MKRRLLYSRITKAKSDRKRVIPDRQAGHPIRATLIRAINSVLYGTALLLLLSGFSFALMRLMGGGNSFRGKRLMLLYNLLYWIVTL